MRLIYLACVCFFICGLTLGSDSAIHWLGVAAILVGVCASGLYLRSLWADEDDLSEVGERDPSGPYTIEDFSSQFANIVLPADGDSLCSRMDQVDVAPDGGDLVVGYGEYLSSIPITDDLERMSSGQHLDFALQASPGADSADTKLVGHENMSGLLEDDFMRYECQFRVSPANVLALRATKFSWTAAAEQLVLPVMPTGGAVAAVRQKMAELARQSVADLRKLMTQGHRSAAAEPESSDNSACKHE